MNLKQTFKNHFALLRFNIIGAILLAGIWWLFFNHEKDALIIFGLVSALYFIPVLYLHIEYTLCNLGEEIEITPNEIVIIKNGEKRSYTSNDLTEIIIYKSANLDKYGFPLSGMEKYNYARLLTKTGQEIVITCLMCLSLEEALQKLSNISRSRVKSFFCALKLK